MAKELAKTYDPKGIEERLYKKWEENGYFHAEVDRSKKPFTIVMPPPNITIRLCQKLGVNYIIRGLRTTTDFELESVISQANKKMAPEINTIFIPASQEYSFVSSTVVRDVLIHGGDASLFLPEGVDIEKYNQ